MKYLFFLLILPSICFAQKNRGYAKIAPTFYFPKEDVRPGIWVGAGPRFNQIVGAGVGIGYYKINDINVVPVGLDFNIIDASKKVFPAFVAKVAYPLMPSGSKDVKGTIQYEVGAGLSLFGKKQQGAVVSVSWSQLRYKDDRLFTTSIAQNMIVGAFSIIL